MNCPQCTSDTTVMDSRHKEGGIKRRRYCQNPECNHRFTTMEVELSVLNRAVHVASDNVVEARWDLQLITHLVTNIQRNLS